MTRHARVLASAVLAVGGLTLFADPAEAGTDVGEIESSSSASGAAVTATSTRSGYSGGGYSGFDGVLDCTWYDTKPSAINPLTSMVNWDKPADPTNTHIYWFECTKIATQQVVERGSRVFDPPNGNPWTTVDTITTTWAFHDWERIPLPPPALQTAPPAPMHIVNLESWFWTQLPPTQHAQTNAGPGNWSNTTATVKTLTLDLDEPGTKPITCPNGGKPWTNTSTEHDPNACTYTFTKHGPHQITATLTWTVTATGQVDGQTVNLTAPDRETTTTLDITVNELLTHITTNP